MTDQTFYHFDRRFFLKKVIGWKKKLKNNSGRLNGFFMGLGLDPKAKNDFGGELLSKVNNYVLDQSLDLDCIPELVSKYEVNGISEIRKAVFELLFEKVRRKDFNNSPSRMTSLFAVKTVEDLENWKQTLGAEGNPYKLSAIKVDSFQEVDSNWFESCRIDKIDEIESFAQNYWDGIKSSDQKIECLITGEFNCEIINSTEN